jgi:anti-anti-sigma regulatory factor
MLELRTFRLADGGSVVAARGGIDAEGTAQILAAVLLCAREGMVVDLLQAQLVDIDALDELVATAGHATFVAARPLTDALDLFGLRRHVAVSPTLHAAVTVS